MEFAFKWHYTRRLQYADKTKVAALWINNYKTALNPTSVTSYVTDACFLVSDKFISPIDLRRIFTYSQDIKFKLTIFYRSQMLMDYLLGKITENQYNSYLISINTTKQIAQEFYSIRNFQTVGVTTRDALSGENSFYATSSLNKVRKIAQERSSQASQDPVESLNTQEEIRTHWNINNVPWNFPENNEVDKEIASLTNTIITNRTPLISISEPEYWEEYENDIADEQE